MSYSNKKYRNKGNRYRKVSSDARKNLIDKKARAEDTNDLTEELSEELDDNEDSE